MEVDINDDSSDPEKDAFTEDVVDVSLSAEVVEEEPKTFHFDRGAIKSLDVTTDEGLGDIEGLTCYDEQTFEMGCIQQLEQHIQADPEPYSELKDLDAIETEQEVAVRLGEITPFGSILSERLRAPLNETFPTKINKKKQTFREQKIRSITKKRKRYVKEKLGTSTEDYVPWDVLPGDVPGELADVNFEESSGSAYEPTDDEPDSSDDVYEKDYEIPKPKKMRKSKKKQEWSEEDFDEDYDWYSSDEERGKKKKCKDRDDGDEGSFQRRIRRWEKSREDGGNFEDFHQFDFFGFKIPKELWDKLYKYQQVGVQWLYELNEAPCGGILGDEMGMGKTIQIINFLAAVHCSKIKNKHTGIPGLGPCMIVCPVTLMHQWVSEFHKWYPPIRIAVLHGSGSFSGSRNQLIKAMVRSNGIIITSYTSLVQHLEILMVTKWHYVILDEGHTIRNPDAQVTLAAKCLRTPHRLILTGSPMQNKLQELWSLFDFVFPGKLGTLPMFMEYYGEAIVQGGFATASEAQVLAGYKCAKALKEIISPFMLRRMKKDVMAHLQLPNKSEQVLFCKLSEEQLKNYRGYINSRDVNDIFAGKQKIFVGLIKLRKICNHPDLFSGGPKLFKGDKEEDIPKEERFGYYEKAGKMIVLATLLKMWYKQKHRVLLFTQSKQMLSIFEMYLKECEYKYLKMDGTTSIGSRQGLVNKFNEDTSYFIMVLTTRVGGLGINLTGADRVVIYDPDWNPATDVQARERAWRIGQDKQVTVYRLITAGTIEEKIYHRQIFKQFLANRVLNDPKQRRFFKANDLMELFTLQDQEAKSTETSAIFAGTESEIQLEKLKKIKRFDLKPERPTKRSKSNNFKPKDKEQKEPTNQSVIFSKEKIEAMKRLAQKMAQQMSGKLNSEKSSTVTSGSLEKLQANEKEDSSRVNEHEVGTEFLDNHDTGLENKVSSLVDNDNKNTTISENTKDNFKDLSLNTNGLGNPIFTTQLSSSEILPSTSSNTSIRISNITETPSTSNNIQRTEPNHHRKHKKKKSKHKDLLFEGEEVPYLVGKEKTKKEKLNEEADNKRRKKQDDYILETLFSKSNICTAMKHDKIMEEGGSDYVVIEKEAEEIAKKAIEALKESMKSCHNAAAGIPTWTGSNGSFKVPTLLLEKIKKRKEAMSNRQQSSHGPISSSELFSNKSKTNKETALIEEIIGFVSSRSNKVTSKAMVERFKHIENAALFKALLNASCNLKTDSNKQKFWCLKDEFKLISRKS